MLRLDGDGGKIFVSECVPVARQLPFPCGDDGSVLSVRSIRLPGGGHRTHRTPKAV